MLRSHHEEVEQTGIYVLATQVYVNECPFCSVVFKVIVPELPEQCTRLA